ncbi:MAG: hypothetical protein PHS66_02480 [Candidatus Omnitrophica bacterium]|nr:hypothetical protein [Candidatus Omnitrophota bacterium]
MHKIGFSVAVVCFSLMTELAIAQDFTWEEIGKDNLNCQAILTGAANSNIIFAGKAGSVFKAEDAAVAWRRVLAVKGSFTDINALAAEDSNPNIIYAATGNGLYRSSDLGEKWERIFHGKNGLENQCTAVLVIGRNIFAGTKAGLFISNDYGRFWHKQQVGIASGCVFNMDWMAGKEPIIYLAACGGLFRSLDFGKSWEKVYLNFLNRNEDEKEAQGEADEPQVLSSINFIKVDPHKKLLYFSCNRGIYRSLSQGQSWEKLPEFGLLDRGVKMICLSSSAQVYALTQSGVFLYCDERWQEVSFGLVLGKLKYLTIDNLDNLYVAGEKGVSRSIRNNIHGFKCSSLISEYLQYEPSIRGIQKAAINYAEVSSEKISQWRKAAAKKAFLPQINLGVDRNSNDLWHWEGGSTTKSDDDVLRRGRDSIDWDISLSWDLSDLIWNEAQASIDVRSKLMVELREDILDQVNKLYFERLRVRSELDNLGIEDRSKRFQKQLKLEELAASLDALTCGYYSERLHALAPKQQN